MEEAGTMTPTPAVQPDSQSPPTDAPILMAQNNPPPMPGASQGTPQQTASQRWASAPDTLPPDPTDNDPAASVAQTGYRNPDALKKYSPTIAANAKMLADYTLPINSYQLARSPMWVQAAQAAHDYDPSFNASQYDIRKALNNSFASGKDSQNLQSINRTIKHLGDLRDTVTALDNPDQGQYSILTKPISAAETWFKTMEGDPRVKNFDNYANAAAGEMVGATRGVGGAEKDVDRWRQQLSASDPKSAQMAAVNSAVDVLAGIAASAREKYIKGMGRPPQTWQFLDPRSRQVLTEMGFDPDKIEHGVRASEARLPTQGQNLQTNTNHPRGIVSTQNVHQYATEHGITDAAASKVFTDANYQVK